MSGRYLQDELEDDALLLSINSPTPNHTFYPPQHSTHIDPTYIEVTPAADSDAALAARLQAEEFAAVAAPEPRAPPIAVLETGASREKPSLSSALCYGLSGVVLLAGLLWCMMVPMINAEQLLLDADNQPTSNGTVVGQGIWFTESCPTDASWRDALNSLNPDAQDPVCTVTSSCDGIVSAEGVAFAGCDVQRGGCVAVRAVSVAMAGLCAAAVLLAILNARCWCAGKLARWALYAASLLGFAILVNYMVTVYTCGFTMAPGTESVAVLGLGYYNFAAASACCLIFGLCIPGPSVAHNARRVRSAYFGVVLILLMTIITWI